MVVNSEGFGARLPEYKTAINFVTLGKLLNLTMSPFPFG